jgi:flagellar biosynthesis/type III secretory pathway chaperone
MKPAANDLRAFSDSVNATLALLERLHAAILEERQALSGAAAEPLEQVVQTKLALLDQLPPLLQIRDGVQQRLGCGSGLAGGDQLMASAPPQAEIRRQWEALKALAAAVEKDNALNGQLAIQGEKAARFGISLLTGRSAEPGTYGRKGDHSDALNGLSLAKA